MSGWTVALLVYVVAVGPAGVLVGRLLRTRRREVGAGTTVPDGSNRR